MERSLTQELVKWKNSPRRKPLLLKGVRQVGQTWLLRDFAENFYDNAVYVNFDENPDYRQFFLSSKNPERTLESLRVAFGQPIDPGRTLIIFDEIQAAPEALGSLKYFCERAPQFHVASAGSLLGVALARPAAFPVGKVDYLQMYPMTFLEFLRADGSANLAEYLAELDELRPLPDAFHHILQEKLKVYFMTGGMPESVRTWLDTEDASEVQRTLANLVRSYERDFSTHPDPTTFPKISRIWRSLPSQLARENRKFRYAADRWARASGRGNTKTPSSDSSTPSSHTKLRA